MRRIGVGPWQEMNVIVVVGQGGVALGLVTESRYFGDPVRKVSL